MHKGHKFSFSFAALLLTVMLTGGCITDALEEESAYEIGVGDPLPEFTVVMSTGDTVRSRELRGTTAVIAFFNTDCVDCRRELPRLQEVYDSCSRRGGGVRFMCIAREQDSASIADYWTAHSLTLPFSPQPDRAVYSLFASSFIPRLYVSSPELRILYSAFDVDSQALYGLLPGGGR